MNTRLRKLLAVPWLSIPILANLVAVALAVVIWGYRPLHNIVAHAIAERAGHIAESDFQAAYNLAQVALRWDPQNASALIVAEVYHSSHGNYEASIPYCQRLIAYRPYVWNTRDQLAEDYYQTGQWELAKEQCQIAIAINAQKPGTHLRLARVAERLGDGRGALDSTIQYLALAPPLQDKLAALQKLSATEVGRAAQMAIPLGRPVGYGRQSSAAIGADGTLHMLGTTSEGKALVYGESQDMAQSWNRKQLVYYGENLDGVAAADPSGTVHMAYGERGGPLIYSTARTGVTTTQAITLTTTAYGQQIALDRAGVSHLVWMDSQANIFGAAVDGTQLQGPDRLATQGWHPSIAVGPEGDIHVAYQGNKSFAERNGPLTYLSQRNGQWSASQAVTAEAGWTGAATLVAAPDGTLYLTYLTGQEAGSCQLKWMMKQPGAAWTDPVALSTSDLPPFVPANFGGRTAPSMMALDDGSVVVVWRAAASAESSPVVVRRFAEGQWSPPEVIGDLGSAHYSSAPTLITNHASLSADRVPILWPEGHAPVVHWWSAK